MGHTVNFRSSKKHYKAKRVKNAPEDWLIFENTYEAIVDAETWHLAQHTKQTRRRIDTTGVANPLTGLLYCPDCGAKMHNHRKRYTMADGSVVIRSYYNRSTYTLTIERENVLCTNHFINNDALMELPLETIRTVSKYALKNEVEFVSKIRAAADVQQACKANAL